MESQAPVLEYPSLEQTWKVIAEHLSQKGASDQNIESFDNFLHRAFPQAVYELFKVDTFIGVDLSRHLQVKVTNVVARSPILLNNDINVNIPEDLKPTASNARLLRSSLVSPVYVSIQMQLGKVVEKINSILLCYMPLMVGCSLTKATHQKKELVDDGYFVLNGSEKVIVAQERKLDRAVLVSNNRCVYRAKGVMSAWWLEQASGGLINIHSKHGKCSVANVFAVYDFSLSLIQPLAVRVETEHFLEHRSPEQSFQAFRQVFPRSEALDLSVLFGSCGRSWLTQLSYMCHSLAKGLDTFDRDHLKNKRVDLSCQLLMTVARKSLSRVAQSYQRRMINYIEKNPKKSMSRGVQRALDARVVTESFFYALSTGNFPSTNHGGVQTGVAQQRSNYNFSSILSQARRIHSGDEKRSIIGQRECRGDHKGFLSPFDTQEGRSCGCSKSFAMCTSVSLEFDAQVIETCLSETKQVSYCEDILVHHPHLVFVNGVVVRQLKDAGDIRRLQQHLLQYRRCGVVDRGVSILVRRKHLFVRTDGGRILRPLFVVEGLHRHLRTSLRPVGSESFPELVRGGLIEFVDSDEEDTKRVAEGFGTIGADTELCEIHPTLILSMNTNYMAPFCNNNQGPRITYQNAMMKQSQSQIPLDFYSNMKSRTHSLLYGQRPLAATKLSLVEGFPQASGLNCIVCIGCFDSKNVEDSIVMSRAFLQRGGYRMLDQKSFHYTGSEIVSNLSASAPWKRHDAAAFRAIDDDGMPSPGQTISAEEILLSKHAIGEDEEKSDSSAKAKDKKGTIQRVIFGHGKRRKKSALGEESIKVNISSYEIRQPICGDKFASLHAQKGTLAHIEDAENLPFNSEGIVPDIIINPACLPTRMTLGQLLEMLGGKAAAMRGIVEDATAFTHPSVDELSDKLHKAGFQRHGDEQLIDGKTGEMMQAKWFTGICYYQRLKHMVMDKLHARSEAGPRSMLTRQPPSGRANGGGHRCGEMESIAVVASGCSLTHRALWNQSDPSKWKVCPACGLYNPMTAQECYSCKGSALPLQEINIPYSFKLLQQELYQCGIMIKDKAAAETGKRHLLAESSDLR